jgi:hypothetical protein
MKRFLFFALDFTPLTDLIDSAQTPSDVYCSR